jgi:Na+/H+ antiporter NhaD/arsenite permease-like protein
MLWVHNQCPTTQIITRTLLPSLVHALVAGALLYRMIKPERVTDDIEEAHPPFTNAERLLMAVTLASFGLPVIVREFFGLSPYLGLLLGLGIVWGLMDHLHHSKAISAASNSRNLGETRLQRDIIQLLRQVDHRSLLFLVGILLVVSALQANGVLDHLSDWLFRDGTSGGRIMAGAITLGYVSAVVDNVPLTALAINVLDTTNSWYWTLLAYTVGTGGSHLVLGSVAGVIAMGKIEGLTTLTYLRLAFIPVFLAYLAGLSVWMLEFWLFG